jgi:hypothetical protein
MAEATIKNNPQIFNRKEYFEELSEKYLKNKTPSYKTRHIVIASQNADGISEQDLRSQVSELRTRKYLSAVSLVSLPTSLYFLKFNTRLTLLSIIPSYLLYKFIWETSLFNSHIDFSAHFYKKSNQRLFSKLAGANGKVVVEPEHVWNMKPVNDQNLSTKDWLARHEYR